MKYDTGSIDQGTRRLWLALFLSSTLLAACGGVDSEDVGASIRDVVESSEPFGADGRDAFREEVRTFYEAGEFEPAWVASKRGRDSLRAVVQVLCTADREGLSPQDYANASLEHLIREAYQVRTRDDSARARSLARLDVAVTHALMSYASDLLIGRVDPHDFGGAWHAPVKQLDLPAVLAGTTSLDSLRALPRALARNHDQYGRLRRALAEYRRIANRGGWRSVEAPGDSSRVRSSLIDRLAATGDLDTTGVPKDSLYRFVPEAVATFQKRHGLEVDSVAGEAVVEAMNVPVEDRIRQIELNLERWRWIPSDLGSRYLYVNIPAYELHVIDRGREALSMAVVVGEVYKENSTPVFADTMEYVEFNPYWNVPIRIATEEILPKARRDREYLIRNNYQIVSGRRVVDPSSADLGLVESGSYRIRQEPGRGNSLGQIKFMFPNQFDIYLHDTPADYLFQRVERAYSHGCIRVERPVELAEYVLGDDEWSSERIREVIGSRDNQSERLENPLPVYILYWTAFVDGDGRVNFREDIYGNDEALRAALTNVTSAAAPVPCDSLVALIR